MKNILLKLSFYIGCIFIIQGCLIVFIFFMMRSKEMNCMPLKEFIMERYLYSTYSLPPDQKSLFIKPNSNIQKYTALSYFFNLFELSISEAEIQKLPEKDILSILRHYEFNAIKKHTTLETLKKFEAPFLVNFDQRLIVIEEIKNNQIYAFDPQFGYIKIRETVFNSLWDHWYITIIL